MTNMNQTATCVASELQEQLNQIGKFISKNLAWFKNQLHLCGANTFIGLLYAKVLSKNKKEAYGCKSRDFSRFLECVSGDLLYFFYPKTF